jgi:hypothetical protein
MRLGFTVMDDTTHEGCSGIFFKSHVMDIRRIIAPEFFELQ